MSEFRYREFEHCLILLSSNNYIQGTYKLLKMINSPWVPEEIKVKMNFLKYSGSVIYPNDKRFENNYAQIQFMEFLQTQNQEFSLIESNIMTYFQFLDKFENLFLAIQKWLNKHTNIAHRINI